MRPVQKCCTAKTAATTSRTVSAIALRRSIPHRVCSHRGIRSLSACPARSRRVSAPTTGTATASGGPAADASGTVTAPLEPAGPTPEPPRHPWDRPDAGRLPPCPPPPPARRPAGPCPTPPAHRHLRRRSPPRAGGDPPPAEAGVRADCGRRGRRGRKGRTGSGVGGGGGCGRPKPVRGPGRWSGVPCGRVSEETCDEDRTPRRPAMIMLDSRDYRRVVENSGPHTGPTTGAGRRPSPRHASPHAPHRTPLTATRLTATRPRPPAAPAPYAPRSPRPPRSHAGRPAPAPSPQALRQGRRPVGGGEVVDGDVHGRAARALGDDLLQPGDGPGRRADLLQRLDAAVGQPQQGFTASAEPNRPGQRRSGRPGAGSRGCRRRSRRRCPRPASRRP